MRARPNTPQHAELDALQRLLCAVVNRACHYDATHYWLLDDLAWAAYQRQQAIDAITRDMRKVMRGGRDGNV